MKEILRNHQMNRISQDFLKGELPISERGARTKNLRTSFRTLLGIWKQGRARYKCIQTYVY
jgi:hypothetical protein